MMPFNIILEMGWLPSGMAAVESFLLGSPNPSGPFRQWGPGLAGAGVGDRSREVTGVCSIAVGLEWSW